MEIEAQRPGDLVGEQSPERAVSGVDPADDLPFVETEANRVVRLPLPGLPGGPLSFHDACQPVEIENDVAVDRLIERE
jgi:hypothetical protein